MGLRNDATARAAACVHCRWIRSISGATARNWLRVLHILKTRPINLSMSDERCAQSTSSGIVRSANVPGE